MPASIIDGKVIASIIQKEVKEGVIELEKTKGIKPGLAVVLVGSRKDSQTYVNTKKKAAEDVGFHSIDIHFPETVKEEEVLETISNLNENPLIHGILVQLPLPSHLNEGKILKKILVEKDVDGFSAENIGNLALRGGSPPLAVPCTPAGCIMLLQRSGVVLKGKHAVVMGRSNIVGMPVALLLLSCDCTVTIVHSSTINIKEECKKADILIAAVGKPEIVRGDWLKPGVVIIDVGINAVDDPSKSKGYKLVGDVCFEEACKVASLITPVPGGVGPMTIAMLMRNTLNLARHAASLPRLKLREDRLSALKDETLFANKIVKTGDFTPRFWARKRYFVLTTLTGLTIGTVFGFLIAKKKPY